MCARAESGKVLRGAIASLAEAVEQLAKPAASRPEPPRQRREQITGARRP